MARLLLIVAAGSGSRLGRRRPKALVELGDRPLLHWPLEAAGNVGFARIVVAAPPDRIEEFARVVGARAAVVAGGETRGSRGTSRRRVGSLRH